MTWTGWTRKSFSWLSKLIRLAGRLPNVYYLLAYDEDTLLEALQKTGLIGQSPRRALDYMEKIVQIRLDVPPLREIQLATWFDREVADLAARLHVAMDEKARQRFDDAYYGHIRVACEPHAPLGASSPRSSRWLLGDSKRDLDADHAFWAHVLTRARVHDSHRDGVAKLLGQLFPKFGAQ